MIVSGSQVFGGDLFEDLDGFRQGSRLFAGLGCGCSLRRSLEFYLVTGWGFWLCFLARLQISRLSVLLLLAGLR